MKKILRSITSVVKKLWQLPQNICGLAYKLYTNPRKIRDGIYRKKNGGSVSLGDYIFLGTDNQWVLIHEQGHQKQSLILGPLYLLVIGLPSLLNASMGWTSKERYYSFYTEAWANKLAGIKYTNEGGWEYVR